MPLAISAAIDSRVVVLTKFIDIPPVEHPVFAGIFASVYFKRSAAPAITGTAPDRQ